ncbi:hypothetical protein HanXRQr2_Chr16g0773041 [Helianthus annuus]|uniref:Uncharacterized protein n=1 Tax=Helianthus annuus TaxID=4232 RepID=A0A9K3DXI3_HELAN|nr:hypothetical protein HanXRQr2_Chr16g0773041 [Helianthus annuus]
MKNLEQEREAPFYTQNILCFIQALTLSQMHDKIWKVTTSPSNIEPGYKIKIRRQHKKSG